MISSTPETRSPVCLCCGGYFHDQGENHHVPSMARSLDTRQCVGCYRSQTPIPLPGELPEWLQKYTRIQYNFAEGHDHFRALLLWDAIRDLTPDGLRRPDRVLFCLRKNVITEEEAQLVIAWLNVFQTESFAQ